MDHSALVSEILDLSRQSRIGPLAAWFRDEIDTQIETQRIQTVEQIVEMGEDIVFDLQTYRERMKIDQVVLGMSGGVDSALTAALFKNAGWRVTGVTMPIHQDDSETQRGIEACKALKIHHIHKDLSKLYDLTVADIADTDPELSDDDVAAKIRRGNIRARLRMITLYNLASTKGGCVASTDNYSELAAGFWTLHGDVGDLAPIQNLTKSWEVPVLARALGVPEDTWRAMPTDGLGISNGDEAQLGCSYLEWDVMVAAIQMTLISSEIEDYQISDMRESLNLGSGREREIFQIVCDRIKRTWFKRENPVVFHNTPDERFDMIQDLDYWLVEGRRAEDKE
jgi:NAD+ synthetase